MVLASNLRHLLLSLSRNLAHADGPPFWLCCDFQDYSQEVLALYRERTNSTTPEIETVHRGALSIQRLEGGRCGGGKSVAEGQLW